MNRVINLRVKRTQGWSEYRVEVPEDAYVLDALQAAQRQDPSLVFRHACHHASCGTCGMRINHREKLACTTPIREAAGARDHRITLEPLRNFPVIADLAVDPSDLLDKMEQVTGALLRVDESQIGFKPLETGEPEASAPASGGQGPFLRYENCIECGLCISACPIAAADSAYLGPAPLAAAERAIAKRAEGGPVEEGIASPLGNAPPLGGARSLVNSAQGVWRCHSAFECTAVCPSDVFPAEAIMRLRRKILTRRV